LAVDHAIQQVVNSLFCSPDLAASSAPPIGSAEPVSFPLYEIEVDAVVPLDVHQSATINRPVSCSDTS